MGCGNGNLKSCYTLHGREFWNKVKSRLQKKCSCQRTHIEHLNLFTALTHRSCGGHSCSGKYVDVGGVRWHMRATQRHSSTACGKRSWMNCLVSRRGGLQKGAVADAAERNLRRSSFVPLALADWVIVRVRAGWVTLPCHQGGKPKFTFLKT